ncbi:hypothetical protein FACS189494_10860 [Spirochaetia bacterium]|nr:hypothetical protein FACS189494_10860 [Spirochaetia bacterium]
MLVLNDMLNTVQNEENKEKLRAAVDSLKKEAPASLQFTEVEFDTYSNKLNKLVNEYQI